MCTQYFSFRCFLRLRQHPNKHFKAPHKELNFIIFLLMELLLSSSSSSSPLLMLLLFNFTLNGGRWMWVRAVNMIVVAITTPFNCTIQMNFSIFFFFFFFALFPFPSLPHIFIHFHYVVHCSLNKYMMVSPRILLFAFCTFNISLLLSSMHINIHSFIAFTRC